VTAAREFVYNFHASNFACREFTLRRFETENNTLTVRAYNAFIYDVTDAAAEVVADERVSHAHV
jgi:hypothetical protein